jgi:hypothetical protein
MCLSDTAEYWWKDPKPLKLPKFVHLKNLNCGHYHVATTNKLINVDCHACISKIKNTPELNKRLEQAIKSKEDHKFRFGKCECGSPMCERKNKKTNQVFLGCVRWPNCTKTKNKTKK